MLNATSLDTLKTLLPKGQLFVDQAARISYEADAGLDKGVPDAVIFPRTAAEVQRIVHWAATHQVPLIARGAGTGLSGGAVADRGGVIVEFSHMHHILDVDQHGRSAIVEPALINLRLDEAVKLHGLYFPPDPSSQRASTIGGNVAENSGGPHCFKYGVTTNYITGLEVVLADGQCIRIGGRALDYPAYDLCGLITGSEGTLALLTSITARLLRHPPQVKTLLAIFDSVEQAGVAVSAVIAAGLVPATLEMMDQQITRIVEPYAHAGLPLDAGAVLIVEVDGYPESLTVQVEEIVSILESHGGYNMRIARDEEERYKIWLARKSAAGAMSRLAPAFYIVDITVPRSRLAEMLVAVDAICARYALRSGEVFHAGDGNLHPNILIPDPNDPDLMERVHTAGWEMVKCCVNMGGSLTGEHGVGIEKRQYMPLMHNAAEMQAMRDVKYAFDPYAILNPGKMFPVLPPDESEEDQQCSGPPCGGQAIYSDPLANASGTLSPRSDNPCGCRLAGTGFGDQTTATQHARQTQEGITTYAPDDLYITVSADTLLRDIQTFLAQDGKQLALASPWDETTIGNLISTNINAPLRMRYGAIRDVTLYVTATLGDGRVIRTGRPIVKNVAGYDLTKIFIGAQGTLGLLTDVTLKIMALPRTKRTLLFPVESMHQGMIWARQMLALALTASAIVLCKGYTYTAPEDLASNYVLVYTAEGLPEDVQVELGQVRQALATTDGPAPIEVESVTGTSIWSEMLGNASETTLLTRVGVPIGHLPIYMQDQAALFNDGSWIADIGNGFLYTLTEHTDAATANIWLNGLREPALACEGYAVVMHMPQAWQGALNRYGYQMQGLDVIKRLKTHWDPHNVMNTGLAY